MAEALVYALMLFLVVLFVAPFLWVLTNALKHEGQMLAWPPVWLPIPPAWQNFPTIMVRWLPFPLMFRNTIAVAVAAVTGELLCSSLVAYGFARYRFPGRGVLFVVLLSTMMVPIAVRLVPMFLFFKNLGWINTLLPLIVPHWFGTPFFIFLVRQFFLTIPVELSDAARIDGASEIGIWWRIMLPLAKPALAAVAIFAFQYVWNDFMAPLVYLQRTEVKTVMLGVYALIGVVPSMEFVMAGVVVVMIPMVALFFAFQGLFVRGIAMTGMKG